MSKELDYDNIAGELQTKAMQFSALKSYNDFYFNKEKYALKYIDDLLFDLREYKKIIKKELLKKDSSE